MIYKTKHNVLKQKRPGRCAVLAIMAAALYALSAPVSKVLLVDVPSNMMAALLYLGAGIGMAVVGCVRRLAGARGDEKPLARSDAPYVVGMVLLDIAAPLLLMAGLASSSAESTALLNNFEIVATALVALVFFHEPVGRRLWAAIAFIVTACAMLSFEGADGFTFSPGSLLVLGASVCWGFENNCTNRLSAKDPLEIVVVKGLGSGAGALAVAFVIGDAFPSLPFALAALVLGFFAYGLSIFFYVSAQRGLGAARTSAYYAFSPFIGVAFSWAIFREAPTGLFVAALALMAAGAYLATPPTAEKE